MNPTPQVRRIAYWTAYVLGSGLSIAAAVLAVLPDADVPMWIFAIIAGIGALQAQLHGLAALNTSSGPLDELGENDHGEGL